MTRIERGEWILEDHLEFTPRSSKLLVRKMSYVLPLVPDTTAVHRCKSEDCLACCGRAASGLSYRAEDFALIDGHRNLIDRCKAASAVEQASSVIKFDG